MADSTLNAIRIKVRRLTRRPSQAQLTDAQLDEYVNTFIQFDFPEHLRTFFLQRDVSFTLIPYKEKYTLEEVGFRTLNPNPDGFKNDYLTITQPVLINGQISRYTQSQTEFYGLYPQNKVINQFATGDGVTAAFTATLKTSVIPGSISITSKDAANVSIVLNDTEPTTFNGVGDIREIQTTTPAGTINYQTGALNINWPTAVPGSGEPIYVAYQARTAGRPQTMLYYGNTFSFRPVPDKSYEVAFAAALRPAELLDAGDIPELAEWWQYIAYGAAKKLLEDNMDMEKVQMIMPEFKKQEQLVLRRTIVQQTNERVATIYSENNVFNGRWPYYNNF